MINIQANRHIDNTGKIESACICSCRRAGQQVCERGSNKINVLGSSVCERGGNKNHTATTRSGASVRTIE